MAIRQARTENKIEPSRKIKAVIYAGQNYKLIKIIGEPQDDEHIAWIARVLDIKIGD